MNVFLSTLVYVIVSAVIVLIGLVLFGLATTKYKDWDEIEKGNAAVALSIGGKIVGLSIIMLFAILESDKISVLMLWGGLGVILQLVIYYIFDFLTPKFSVQEKLKEGNIAVGIISLCVSIGIGFVIGASIT